MRILLLEANSIRRQNIALALTTTGGFNVSCFSSVSQAHIWLTSHRADLCLISERLYAPACFSLPMIILGQGKSVTADAKVLGCIANTIAIVAIPQAVRDLL